MKQASDLREPFSTDDKVWNDATDEQLAKWLEAAEQFDRDVKEIRDASVDLINQAQELLKQAFEMTSKRDVFKLMKSSDHGKVYHKVINYINNNRPARNLPGSRVDLYHRMLKSRKQREDQLLKEAVERQLKVSEKELRDAAIVQLTIIAIDLGLDLEMVNIRPSSILDEILERDKYLNLAHAGVMTRGDWSNGFYQVEQALNEFTLASDVDQKIVTEYQEILSDPYIDDGRVFRNCDYNYDVLFSMSDPKLKAHYDKVLEYIWIRW